MFKVLLTCPPMIRSLGALSEDLKDRDLFIHVPEFTQVLTESELLRIIDSFDGWIIGDDPATRAVLEKGKKGKLRAIVKWGVGIDNVDSNAAKDLGFNLSNTPNMFGCEVADIAISYAIMLARHLHVVNRGVHAGEWPKPVGISLLEKKMGIIGFGDIGRNVAIRANACGLKVLVYEPNLKIKEERFGFVDFVELNHLFHESDFIVFCCSLNATNYHLFDHKALQLVKRGVFLINVSRGALIDEETLVDGLTSEIVAGAALEVFEIEPLSWNSRLRKFPNIILGSHNASNTVEAVLRTSRLAIKLLADQF